MSLLQKFLGGNQAQMPGQASQPSGFSQMMQPEVLAAMAGQLLGNQGNAANFGNAFQAAAPVMAQQRQLQAQTAEQNKTWDWLEQQGPEFGQLRQSGMAAPEALKLYTEQRFAQSKNPAAVQEYEYAKQQGYNGSFMDFQMDQKRAGATNVTVGGGKYGPIPSGMELIDGPEGATMRPIPGGPADTTRADNAAAGQRDVSTRIITDAASTARKAASNRQFGEYGQGIASGMPWTDSAEVQRQVDVLKSQATFEKLAAMRAGSATGASGLGALSDNEAKMLAAQAGALDPGSPNFARDLDNYELTLLQTIHGPEEGTRLFKATRIPGASQQGGGEVDSLVEQYRTR